jgi:hypothetical protein
VASSGANVNGFLMDVIVANHTERAPGRQTRFQLDIVINNSYH